MVSRVQCQYLKLNQCNDLGIFQAQIQLRKCARLKFYLEDTCNTTFVQSRVVLYVVQMKTTTFRIVLVVQQIPPAIQNEVVVCIHVHFRIPTGGIDQCYTKRRLNYYHGYLAFGCQIYSTLNNLNFADALGFHHFLSSYIKKHKFQSNFILL